jgi:hypothetical protein
MSKLVTFLREFDYPDPTGLLMGIGSVFVGQIVILIYYYYRLSQPYTPIQVCISEWMCYHSMSMSVRMIFIHVYNPTHIR